jgi:hypothetical protein
VEYSASGLAQQANRVFIFKQDYDADLCTQVTIVDTQNAGSLEIDVPSGWDVETARVIDGADNCYTPPEFQVAGAGSGSITWDEIPEGSYIPCLLTIDVELLFQENFDWTPNSVTLNAVDLEVSGCE